MLSHVARSGAPGRASRARLLPPRATPRRAPPRARPARWGARRPRLLARRGPRGPRHPARALASRCRPLQ
ncbi:MAG: hypothetical protein DMD86_16270 [Candidatus Rokuibacteriota bacterium]|nr:MAG: hypothetical protein DMD86_16270 [Candidatus Rokubacteria bacterium]